jgi:C_GCAxxG_C_C family probable redox protein
MMTGDEAAARARELFLDDANVYGCAETAFVVLKEAFDLEGPDDSSAAMALNGGVAYNGGVCGAICGAAVAVGMLAGRRFDSRAAGKTAAREVVAGVIDAFRLRYSAIDCRALLGREIRAPQDHLAFIESGVWRVRCMEQIEFVVRTLAPLPQNGEWSGPSRAAARGQRG